MHVFHGKRTGVSCKYTFSVASCKPPIPENASDHRGPQCSTPRMRRCGAERAAESAMFGPIDPQSEFSCWEKTKPGSPRCVRFFFLRTQTLPKNSHRGRHWRSRWVQKLQVPEKEKHTVAEIGFACHPGARKGPRRKGWQETIRATNRARQEAILHSFG